MSSINAPSVNTCVRPAYVVPRTVTDLVHMAGAMGISPTEALQRLEADLGPGWWEAN